MRECGQTVVEWLVAATGIVVLAASLAVAAPSVAPAVAGGMQTEICRVTGGSCDGHHAEPAPSAPGAQPAPAAPPVPQQPAAPPRDFCGSGYVNVPELWFTSACEGHDRCYAAHRGKAACDTAFLNDMLATCAKLPSSSSGLNSNLTRASCRAAARLYYKGVVIGGGFSYCHHAVCREERRMTIGPGSIPASALSPRRRGCPLDPGPIACPAETGSGPPRVQWPSHRAFVAGGDGGLVGPPSRSAHGHAWDGTRPAAQLPPTRGRKRFRPVVEPVSRIAYVQGDG